MEELYIKYLRDDRYTITKQTFTQTNQFIKNQDDLCEIVISCYPDSNSQTIWLRGSSDRNDKVVSLHDYHLKSLRAFCDNNKILYRIIIK